MAILQLPDPLCSLHKVEDFEVLSRGHVRRLLGSVWNPDGKNCGECKTAGWKGLTGLLGHC